MKQCNKCHEIKDLGEFSKNRAKKDGHQGQCKPCKAAADKRYKGTGDKIGAPTGNSNASGVNRTDPLIEAIDDTRLLDHRKIKYLRISRIINNIRKTGYARKITWHLSNQDAAELIVQDCYYCGQESKHDDTIARNPYNGLDRIDSAGNYSLDNVVPCCRHCNKAKLSMTHEEFLDLIKRIYNKHWSQLEY